MFQVHNGRNNNSALIGKYCGDSIPHSVTSSGNVLHVKFHADRSIQHIGFKASYTSLNAGKYFIRNKNIFFTQVSTLTLTFFYVYLFFSSMWW